MANGPTGVAVGAASTTPSTGTPRGHQATQGQKAAPAHETTVAARFAEIAAQAATGHLDCPPPGTGDTARRFDVLRRIAAEDLSLGRLAEGHFDAVAILRELGDRPPAPGERWGVWAAEPPGTGVTARREGNAWSLTGLKRYCSGARACTHALVTARSGENELLLAVELDPATCVPAPGTWPAVGMAASDSLDVRFRGAAARVVGAPGAYLRRPGFHHGGVGVAACWLGGADAVARVLYAAAARSASPLRDSHLGAVEIDLRAAWAVLAEAAAEIDDDPLDHHGGAAARALRARGCAAAACARVLDGTGEATGAGPLCHDARHARAVADLTVYVRQHHGRRDLAALGAHVSGRSGDDGP
ncbi:acyl-CoA dehydrogenase [Streptomyces otsuchiensis]|uniref:acyl-CoA dehydrogenase n=1 Tax=Streptomyces otsuchiensis TaxID=2681388 RepID=UPI00102F80AB|nr:acyl-CoA dehydrogenase [Streptomyces otsuchiensis]